AAGQSRRRPGAAAGARRLREETTRRSRAWAAPPGWRAAVGRRSFAILAALERRRLPGRHEDVAQPSIEIRELPRDRHEGLDDEAVQDGVEKSAFERDEIEAAAHAIRRKPLEPARRRSGPVADRVFHPMQIVEDVRS